MSDRNDLGSKKDLYMPVNAPDADDIIQGVGAFELYVYVVGFFFCVGIGIGLYFSFHNSMLALALVIGVFSLIVLIFRRDIYNENLIKKIKVIKRFFKEQKIYEYQYHNIYEVRGGKDEEAEE